MPTYPTKNRSAHNSNKIMVTNVQPNSFDASDSGVKRTQESSEMRLKSITKRKDDILEFAELIISKYIDANGYINMRSIHDCIGVERDYSSWVKSHIRTFEFDENIDYKTIKYDYLNNLIDINDTKTHCSRIDHLLTNDACFVILMQEIISAIKRLKEKTKTYLIKNRDTGLTKIGRTYKVKERVRALKTLYGDVFLYAIIDKDIEKMLHEKYRMFSSGCEWFKLDDKTIDEIVSTFGFVIVQEN